MKRHVLIARPEFEADVANAYNWFRVRDEDLATTFLNAVDDCLNLIEQNPLAYAKVEGEGRRALLKKFSYAIFYLVIPLDEETEIINVAACVSTRRDPQEWRKRLN